MCNPQLAWAHWGPDSWFSLQFTAIPKGQFGVYVKPPRGHYGFDIWGLNIESSAPFEISSVTRSGFPLVVTPWNVKNVEFEGLPNFEMGLVTHDIALEICCENPYDMLDVEWIIIGTRVQKEQIDSCHDTKI